MLILAAMMALAAPAAERPPLADEIARASERYFTLHLDKCDPARFRAMLTPDFENFNDNNGFRGLKAHVARYRERCKAERDGRLVPLRRKLVPGSFRVFPLPGYGALEEGAQEFYQRDTGLSAGKARYIQVWRKVHGQWRISRRISYDHQE